MSATTQDAAAPADGTTGDAATAETTAPETSLNEKQTRILTYLREHVATKTYFKSRLIADEIGLSSKEVGTNMPAIREGVPDITVEKWGYSSATTWKVTA